LLRSASLITTVLALIISSVIFCNHSLAKYSHNIYYNKTENLRLKKAKNRYRAYLNLGSGYSINSAQETQLGIDQTTESKFFNKKSTSLENNIIFRAEIGYMFNSYIRGGIEASFMPLSRLAVKAQVELNEDMDDQLLIGQLSSYGMMSNIYYHPIKLRNTSIFSPYIMAGAGIYINTITDLKLISVPALDSNVSTTDFLFNNSIPNFAWQAGVGNIFNLTNNLKIDIIYRFLDRGSAKSKDAFVSVPNGPFSIGTFDSEARATFKRLYSHQIMIGAIIRF